MPNMNYLDAKRKLKIKNISHNILIFPAESIYNKTCSGYQVPGMILLLLKGRPT